MLSLYKNSVGQDVAQPTTEAKLIIKSLNMEQKINSVTSAETNDEVSANVEVSTSSPNNAKPNVGCSASHSDTGMTLKDDGNIFYCLDCWKKWRYKIFDKKPDTIESLDVEIDAEFMAIKFNMSRGKSNPKTKQELIKMMDDYNTHLGYVCYDYKS